jgi:hypothetical protein
MYFIVRAAAWGDVDVAVQENCVCDGHDPSFLVWAKRAR